MTEELPSKTQRKRQMHDLQDLGAQLVALNEQQLATVELPEDLRDAVLDAQRMRKFEARRRQLQYIGKLMRNVDPEPIRSRLAAYTAVSTAQTARLHMLERWRLRLLEEEGALAALLEAYPHTDAPRLRTLIRNTLREREAGQPPKSFRALFHLLDDTIPSAEEGSHGDQ